MKKNNSGLFIIAIVAVVAVVAAVMMFSGGQSIEVSEESSALVGQAISGDKIARTLRAITDLDERVTALEESVASSSGTFCIDECSSGDMACDAWNFTMSCGNYDSDPCLEWSRSTSCYPLDCNDGICG